MSTDRQEDRDANAGRRQVGARGDSDSIAAEEHLADIQRSLDDIREAGRRESDSSVRADLQWEARQLGDEIWRLRGDYPETKLKAFGPLEEMGTQPAVAAAPADDRRIATRERRIRSTKVFNVPFSRNPYFTGRDSVLQDIQLKLGQVRKVAICGLSGVGKTQVAVQYVCEYKDQYSIVVWANGSSKEEWEKDFQKIADSLNLPEKRAMDLSMTSSAVREWLRANPGYLLVLDGVQEFSDVAELVHIGNGYVLATTENSNIGDAVWPVEIEPMSHDEGSLFLLRRATLAEPHQTLDDVPSDVRGKAMAIVEKMGGLPLALDQAGAYISEFRVGLDEYLRMYERSPDQLLDCRGTSILGSHIGSVADTINLRVARLAENDETAMAERFLKIASFFDEQIPDEILANARAFLGGDKIAPPLHRLRSWLQRFSLIERNPRAKVSSIHRLVQEVVRGRMSGDERAKWTRRAAQAVDRSLYLVRFWSYRDLIRYRRVESSAALLVHDVAELGKEFRQAVPFLSKLGAFYCQEANYLEATRLFSLALDIVAEETGEKALALKGLAQVYIEEGRYDEAEALVREAREIWSRLTKPSHIDWAMASDTLGFLCIKTGGRFADAERYLEEALQHSEQTFGHRKWLLQGAIYNSQAWLSAVREPSDLSRSEELCRRGLALREKALGNESLEVAWSLDNLAGILGRKGEYDSAIETNKLALELRRSLLSLEHPHSAMSLKTLASLYREQRRYPDAIKCLEEALSILKKAKGSGHPEVAWMLRDLGELNMLDERLERAEECFEEAEQIYANRPMDDDTSKKFWRLYADFLEKIGRAPQARAIREEYLDA